jgi:hypothetical protein
MIRLLAVRAFIPVWARAISLSDKLSEKTWKFLVALQCVIFILSAGGFRESRLSSPFAPYVTTTRVSPRVDSMPLWVSLFGLIVSPISAASTAVVAWISVHRGRADALLKKMQIEKMGLEMEKLRIELEQARLEAVQHQSRIVIAAG